MRWIWSRLIKILLIQPIIKKIRGQAEENHFTKTQLIAHCI